MTRLARALLLLLAAGVAVVTRSGDPRGQQPASAGARPPAAHRRVVPRRGRGRVLALLLAAAVGIVSAMIVAGGQSPARTLAVTCFLLAGPGLGLAPLIGLRDTLGTLTVAIALSIGLDTIVAGGLLYAGAWSPTTAFAILACITLAGVVGQLILPVEPPA